MSVLVSGATTSEIPSPNVMSAGSTSMNDRAGGMSVDGFSNVAFHGSDVGRDPGPPEHAERP